MTASATTVASNRAHRHRTSYLAWAWNADFNCSSGPGLITSYDGQPTGYGIGYRAHLRKLAKSH